MQDFQKCRDVHVNVLEEEKKKHAPVSVSPRLSVFVELRPCVTANANANQPSS